MLINSESMNSDIHMKMPITAREVVKLKRFARVRTKFYCQIFTRDTFVFIIFCGARFLQRVLSK
jgi:hypothetical protein